MNWRRFLKFAGISIAVIAVVIVGLIVRILFIFGDYTDTEVARFSNPANSIEAIVVERSGNATVSMITLVYVVANGEKPSGDPPFLADNVEGLAVRWIDDRTVQVHADNARVSKRLDEVSIGAKRETVVGINYEILKSERQ